MLKKMKYVIISRFEKPGIYNDLLHLPSVPIYFKTCQTVEKSFL